ncbi:alpha/beta hydrolase [Salinibacterium sp. TMP30]|uniref:alpha/beta fold hydrolase n=1 Tax=Salinibacterium sp. TMP30 TaxID=3138237 RepID=UPI0031397804
MSFTPLWLSDSGDGEPLVFLHPGGTDSRAMTALKNELPEYRQILIDRAGHGHSADTDDPWSFAGMADAVAAVLDQLEIPSAHIVGWSDGAIVGLHLALRRPDLTRTLVFGGAAYHFTGWLDGVLDGDPPQFMSDAYAEVSPDGALHWPIVVDKAAELHRGEPDVSPTQLETLAVPVLIVVGDDDQVRFDHLVQMYDALPDAELAVVPRATHGLIVEKPELLARMIRDLHQTDRTNGVAPIRRN